MTRFRTLSVVAALVLLVLVFGCSQVETASQTGKEAPDTVLVETPQTGKRAPDTVLVEAAPQVGKMAPDFTLTSLTGEVIQLSAFRGKPVLLNFWATWCPPCRDEIPLIQSVFEESSGAKLAVMSINGWEDKATIQEFMSKSGLTFPVLLNYPGKATVTTYKVVYIPTTFIIDATGIIKSIKVGSFESKAELESVLK